MRNKIPPPAAPARFVAIDDGRVGTPACGITYRYTSSCDKTDACFSRSSLVEPSPRVPPRPSSTTARYPPLRVPASANHFPSGRSSAHVRPTETFAGVGTASSGAAASMHLLAASAERSITLDQGLSGIEPLLLTLKAAQLQPTAGVLAADGRTNDK